MKRLLIFILAIASFGAIAQTSDDAMTSYNNATLVDDAALIYASDLKVLYQYLIDNKLHVDSLHKINLGDLGNVDLTGLGDGNTITYDLATQTWQPSTAGSGTDANAIHDNVSGEINALTEKASPGSTDLLIIEDASASYAKKKVQIQNLPGGSPTTYNLSLANNLTFTVGDGLNKILTGAATIGVTAGYSIPSDANQTNWTTGYNHSQIVTGNPHSLDAADVGAEPAFTTLPIADGGTNSSTALNNGFVMISNTGAIVESSTITTTELNLLDGKTALVETEVDGSVSNEGSLTVNAGTGTTSIINSNTSGSTDVTISVGAGLSTAEAGNTITLTNTDLGSSAVSTHEGSYTHSDIALNTADRHASGSDNQNLFSQITDGTTPASADGQTDAFKLVSANSLLTIATANDDATHGDYANFTVNESSINHNNLTNTHNLTTDIDHNSLTNTHNLTTDIDHNTLTNSGGNQHIDWTGDQGATNIHAGNMETFTTTVNGLVPAPSTTNNYFLRDDGTWQDATSSGMSNPMTTAGDIIYGGASGTPTRLAGATTDNWMLYYDTDLDEPYWAAQPAGGTQNLAYTASTGTVTIDGGGTDATIGGFSTTTADYGFVLGSSNNTTYFLRGDNSWQPVITTEVDGSISNEGSLTVAAGTATTSLIQSNTSGSTDVTLEVSTGLSSAEVGNTITFTNSDPGSSAVSTHEGSYTHSDIALNTTHRTSDGSDHSFIDQSVVSGAAPTFLATNFSDGGTNAIITTTQETNFESAYTHSTTTTGNPHSLAVSDLDAGGTWKVLYSNGTGAWQELALGADGTYLKSNGVSAIPSFATPGGSGDVSKVGTPADNEIGVWTGDGTLEGDPNYLWDGSKMHMNTGSAITAWNTATSTLLFQAYDTDAPGYITFATLTSGTTPTFDLNVGTTIASNAIAYSGGSFHDGFSDFAAEEHYRWDNDIGATATIHGNNITNVDPDLASGFLKTTTGTGLLSTQSSISLTADVTGILPIANGGTNSSTTLNNGFVMISNAGSIVESATVTTTELGLLDGKTNSLVDYTGTMADTYIPYWTANGTQSGEAAFVYDDATNTMTVENMKGNHEMSISSTTYEGTTEEWTAGTGGIAQYDLVYVSGNNTILKVDRDAASTGKCLGIAVEAIGQGSTGTILTKGVIYNAAWAWTAGQYLYTSSTAGAITSTIPATTGTGQRVGVAIDADRVEIQIGSFVEF